MSRDVYDIFETTGFTELLDVKKALRKVIGLEYELSKRVWGITLSAYYGTTDSQKLELLGQRCGSFSLLRMATALGMVKTDLSRTNKGEQQ